MTLSEITVETPVRFKHPEKCGLCGGTTFRVDISNVCDGPIVEEHQTEALKLEMFCSSPSCVLNIGTKPQAAHTMILFGW